MKDEVVKLLPELLGHLERNVDRPITKKVFVGFDGFVDKIMKAVKQDDHFHTDYFNTIQEFASRIAAASGRHGQIELALEQTTLGGNAPTLSNILGQLGVSSYCAATLGFAGRHLSSSMHTKCEVISLQTAGERTTVEFDDGNIIFSDFNRFCNYDWNFIKRSSEFTKFKNAINESQIVVFVDWAKLPYSSEIWDGILEDIIKPSGRHDFYFIFDLCDPSKKTTIQIDEILDIMSDFSVHGKVTLSLNEGETMKIWSVIHGGTCDDRIERVRMPAVKQAGAELYKAMNIDCLLIHPNDRTIVYHQTKTIELEGRLVKRPKVLTGGGDNLNAGYCLGLLLQLPVKYCALLGMATSGAYVQNGVSPDVNSIMKYIEVWIEELQEVSTAKDLYACNNI